MADMFTVVAETTVTWVRQPCGAVTLRDPDISAIVDAINLVESGEATLLETIETFGLMLRSGVIGSLQGSWQRAVSDMLASGWIDEDGNVTDSAIAMLDALPEV